VHKGIAMAWPQPTEYNEAIQNPLVCFCDPELRQGQVDVDGLSLPRARSGNLADVYRVHCPASANTWAVKCFTRRAPGLQERYQAIHAYLQHARLRCTTDFQYLDQGICIRGQWYPVLKMRWVEGLMLNEFMRAHADNPAVLAKLAHLWIKLARHLRRAAIAHGDLQHGNVVLVPATRAQALSLRLIDYDGMYVPALANQPSGERGHPNYQHPQRLEEGTYHAGVDRFSHLIVYTALRCLILGGKALWVRHDNGENLLFREHDFRDPSRSLLLQELSQLADPGVRTLVGNMVRASRGPLEDVPFVTDLVADDEPMPVPAAEQTADVHWAATMRNPCLSNENDKPPPVRLRFEAEPPTLGGSNETAAAGLASLTEDVPSSTAALLQSGSSQQREPQRWLDCCTSKSWLNAACPHCGRIDGKPLAAFSFMTILAGLCLFFGQPDWLVLPGLLIGLGGLVGLPLALGRVVESWTAPGGVGVLMAQVGLQPARLRVCRRCEEERHAGWLACPHCSCIDLGAAVALGSLGVLCLLAALLANAGRHEAASSQALLLGVGRAGLMLGCLALLALIGGIVEVSKTQARLRRLLQTKADLPGVETATTAGLVLASMTLLVLNLSTGQQPQVASARTPLVQVPVTVGLQEPTPLTSPLVAPPSGEKVYPAPVKADPSVTEEAAGPGSLTAHTGPVQCVAFSPDGTLALSGSADRTVRLWNVRSRKQLRVFQGHTDSVLSVAFAADRTRGLSAGHDGTLRGWDLGTGMEIQRQDFRAGAASMVSFSPDGKVAALGGTDGIVRIWDLASKTEVVKLKGHSDAVTCLAFSADGKRLIAGGDDCGVRVWNVANAKVVLSFANLGGAVRGVAFSPRGDRIAACGDNQPIHLWDAASGRELKRLQGHSGSVASVAFSVDGSLLLSGGDDCTVRLWDEDNSKKMLLVGEHVSWVNSVAFSPDGRHALSGGNEPAIRLWQLAE
jgi:WD40 repeat protein